MDALNNQFFFSPSEDLDRFFGLHIDEIEDELLKTARSLRPEGNLSNLGHVLHGGHQTWVGLDPQTLNTPYSELAQLCTLLAPKAGELVVDLGAGYGRLGLVLHYLCPNVKFLGHELVKERVEEGNRVFLDRGCENAVLYVQDLTTSEFRLPVADYYFIYDYGKVSHIRQTLKQLEALAETKHFKVIARGKGVRSIIDFEHPWLSDINPVVREENFSIYTF